VGVHALRGIGRAHGRHERLALTAGREVVVGDAGQAYGRHSRTDEVAMYARVARWEGADAEALRRSAEEINSQASSGPPPGVPAKAFMMLIDPESGRNLSIVLFETEEDLRKGDETLNGMSPTGGDDVGERVSVETYEVAVDVKA
jgi:hypothetical protein